MHKSEQNSLLPQTCAATLSSLHPQTCRCVSTFNSLNISIIQLQQKLIIKFGVPNAIKRYVKMILRKRLASVS